MAVRVLIIDDESFVLRALARGLARSGLEVITAKDAADGLCVIEETPKVAAVISDLRMPGSDGRAFLDWCASQHPDVGRILLTGFVNDIDKSELEAEGIRVLSKPWNAQDLISSVWSAIFEKDLD